MNLERELGLQLQAGVKKSEPMALHTSWKVGGPADYFLLPGDLAELVTIVRYSSENALPLFILGNGTNLLVLDGGIRGAVVNIGQPFQYIDYDDKVIRAGAGVTMTYLARDSSRRGLAGLEFAGGIPGTLGGALVMNAGAFGSYIGDHVVAVKVVRWDGNVCSLEREDLDFAYRSSNLSGMGVIVEALLQLDEGDPAELTSRVDTFLAERRRRHPHLPSAGSVFRNPPDQPAGRLIEKAGGKGMCVGGAQVSEQHANFIVNLGDATASDILELIKAVQRLVKEKFDITLHPEVRVVGEEK